MHTYSTLFMKESRIQEMALGVAPTTRREIGKINATIKISYDGEFTRNIDKFVRELNKKLNQDSITLTHFSVDELVDKNGYSIKTRSGAEGDEDCINCPEEMQAKAALRAVAKPPSMHQDNMKVGEVSAFNAAFSAHITDIELEQKAVEEQIRKNEEEPQLEQHAKGEGGH